MLAYPGVAPSRSLYWYHVTGKPPASDLAGGLPDSTSWTRRY